MGSGLTVKREKFAQLVASGATQSDALRQTFDGDPVHSESIHEQASRLAADGKVAARINELRDRYASVAELDATYIIDGLRRNAEQARSNGDYAPSNKALELLGRQLHGMFTEKTEIDVTLHHELDSASVADLTAMLEALRVERLSLQAGAEVIDGEAHIVD